MIIVIKKCIVKLHYGGKNMTDVEIPDVSSDISQKIFNCITEALDVM